MEEIEKTKEELEDLRKEIHTVLLAAASHHPKGEKLKEIINKEVTPDRIKTTVKDLIDGIRARLAKNEDEKELLFYDILYKDAISTILEELASEHSSDKELLKAFFDIIPIAIEKISRFKEPRKRIEEIIKEEETLRQYYNFIRKKFEKAI